jgi:hypothetical protein
MGLRVYNSSKSEGSMMFDDAFFSAFLANITRMTTTPPPRWSTCPRWTRLLSKFGGVEPGWRRRLQKKIGVSTLGNVPFDHSTRFHNLLLT